MKSLPGSPDIVLKKYKTVIFIHGCFWHSHECLKGKIPQTNVEFWQQKLARNKERDLAVREELRLSGWKTMVVWECQLKPKVRQQTLQEIAFLLNKANLVELHRKYQVSEEPLRVAAEEIPKYGK